MEARFRAAHEQGHLRYYPSTMHECISASTGLRFELRYCPALLEKTETPAGNPFLPYDANLWLDDLPHDHVLLFNKFCVVPHHLLVIPRDFEAQTAPLGSHHFVAVAEAARRHLPAGYLAFYNGGVNAGASQPHRHFQLMPLEGGGGACLVEQAMEKGVTLPFAHGLARVRGPADWHATFQRLTNTMDAACFSLLFTDRWMMLVPRPAVANPWSLNSLAFAGYLLAKTEADLQAMQAIDPMTVLTQLTGL